MRELLGSTLPTAVILEPGTQFGPLHAELRGKPFDLLVDASTYALLANTKAAAVLGANVDEAIRADIRTQLGERLEYLELVLPYIAEITPSSFERLDSRCPKCGHRRADLAKKFRLLGSSLPANQQVFRAMNWPAEIFVTDKLKKLIIDSDLTGVSFDEVEVCNG